MSYIYVITNDINNKQYVGKTNLTIDQRFKQHLKDSKKEQYEKRPLYNAINKYGIEHFSIKELEKCSPEEASVKEIYWIGRLNTYNNGYNATLGGDSKHYYNYKEIADKYLELQNQKETAEYFECDVHTVRTACKNQNIPLLSSGEVLKKKKGKKVDMLSLKGNFIRTFSDMTDAAKWLKEQNITTAQTKNISCSIGRAASGKMSYAYNHKWRFNKE